MFILSYLNDQIEEEQSNITIFDSIKNMLYSLTEMGKILSLFLNKIIWRIFMP